MASSIKMSPAEVRTTSNVYSQSSQDIEQMLGQLKKSQNQLASAWEGDAFEAFEEQFNVLAPKVKDFSELLTDIYDQLNKIADIIEETDEKIGTTVRKGF